MFIEKEYLDKWFQKVMERFDRLENSLVKPQPERERQTFNGELLLDNQDLCIMLNISKRSLQRYRILGWLPFRQIDQKIYYLQSEVETFIRERFEKRQNLQPDGLLFPVRRQPKYDCFFLKQNIATHQPHKCRYLQPAVRKSVCQ